MMVTLSVCFKDSTLVQYTYCPRDLYFNALGGNVDLVREALEKSADPNGINRNGFTPLHAAAFKGTR